MYVMSLPPKKRLAPRRIRKPSPKGIQDLPLELLPDIVDCAHPPPSANRALRDVWKRKCCTGLQMQLHALATTISTRPVNVPPRAFLWHGPQDRNAARAAGHPHYDIPLSNTGIRSRCLAASIAYVHARCRQVHVGQNFVIFQLPGGWYRQLSFGGCRQEVQEGIEIIKRGSPCITRLGPMWWNVDPPPTLHDRLGIIYKWRMLYNGAT